MQRALGKLASTGAVLWLSRGQRPTAGGYQCLLEELAGIIVTIPSFRIIIPLCAKEYITPGQCTLDDLRYLMIIQERLDSV